MNPNEVKALIIEFFDKDVGEVESLCFLVPIKFNVLTFFTKLPEEFCQKKNIRTKYSRGGELEFEEDNYYLILSILNS